MSLDVSKTSGNRTQNVIERFRKQEIIRSLSRTKKHEYGSPWNISVFGFKYVLLPSGRTDLNLNPEYNQEYMHCSSWAGIDRLFSTWVLPPEDYENNPLRSRQKNEYRDGFMSSRPASRRILYIQDLPKCIQVRPLAPTQIPMREDRPDGVYSDNSYVRFIQRNPTSRDRRYGTAFISLWRTTPLKSVHPISVRSWQNDFKSRPKSALYLQQI